MDEDFNEKLLANLVLYGLENYSKTMNKSLMGDEKGCKLFLGKNSQIYRAIHWYLLENNIIEQKAILSKEYLEAGRIDHMEWEIKKFDSLKICKNIIEKYKIYLMNFANNLEKVFVSIDSNIENILREQNKEEIDNKFAELQIKYEGDANLIASEFNKYLRKNYFEKIRN